MSAHSHPVPVSVRSIPGSVDNLIDALITIQPHSRRPGGPRAQFKGRMGSGPPPVLNLKLRSGPPDKLISSRVCVEAVPYHDGGARSVKFQIWKASLLEGVISVDKSNEIVQANLGAILLFGYKEEEMLGSHVSSIIPAKARTTLHQARRMRRRQYRILSLLLKSLAAS